MTAYMSQPIVTDVLNRREQQVWNHLQERAVRETRGRVLWGIWRTRGARPWGCLFQATHVQPPTRDSSGNASAVAAGDRRSADSGPCWGCSD
jgi:hypothetical protein